MRRPNRVEPGPGQESVWDYPRPPRVEPTSSLVEVVLGGRVVARTTRALRVLETSHPPTYYIPMADFAEGSLVPAAGTSFCEWKGTASYLDVHGGNVVAERAAWYYPEPSTAFAELRDHVAVYPGAMERCLVDGEVVRPQPGGFYGGWITSRVVGPFKGDPGTRSW
ncbi:MAG TPA: DUF427 domain-containing protein [Nocardioidaceae bacterium]|nr:DUF427 domain-containing protein [Nocardioidaceae bacterium]